MRSVDDGIREAASAVVAREGGDGLEVLVLERGASSRFLPGYVAFPGGSLYATGKSALTGLTKSLARELGERGITSNLVHPGPIDTDMNPADGPSAEMQRGFTALGRYGHPSDVAATVSHLAGPAGRYITGAAIAVDGGFAV